MNKLQQLNEAQDGSIIRYRGGICWKSEGTWHALSKRQRTIGYGDVTTWNAHVFLAEELNLNRVELVDLV